MLLQSINLSLEELKELLQQITNTEYCFPCTELSGSTIGEHTRHIIEMFQCLTFQYESGIVNYDKRQRNILIQTNIITAVQALETIKISIDKINKEIILQQIIDGEEIRINSNYHRELLYNFEHCIHHQALIKVALLKCKKITVSENFGIARSTIEYRKQCAQ